MARIAVKCVENCTCVFLWLLWHFSLASFLERILVAGC
jgi:hypothetical protein